MNFIHKHYTNEKQKAEKSETKVKQQNAQLKKLNSDKDLFMRILAHDLRNPFNTLMGFSELVLINIRKYDIEKVEGYLKTINQMSHETYNLLDDLLLWSKSLSGKLPFERQKLVLFNVYNDLVSTLKYNAKFKNIDIRYFESEKIIIMADLNMIKTILRNLISNAIKFTNENGKINIYTEKNDKFVTITVSDTGIGIEESNYSKIWDTETLYTTTGTTNEKGTGFGLLLCKDFIEKHGGKIWVKSEVGKGSDFKFTMPVE